MHGCCGRWIGRAARTEAVLLVMYLLRGREREAGTESATPAGLVARTAKVARDEVVGRPAEALLRHEGWRAARARVRRLAPGAGAAL